MDKTLPVGGASRGDYAQDVRRDCFRLAHPQKSIAARRDSHNFSSRNQFVAKEALNEFF